MVKCRIFKVWVLALLFTAVDSFVPSIIAFQTHGSCKQAASGNSALPALTSLKMADGEFEIGKTGSRTRAQTGRVGRD